MGGHIPTQVRIKVANRDLIRCVRCNMPGNNWHHRRSRSITDPHTHCPCNGVTMCGSGSHGCHGWVHSHPFEARAKGWIVSRYSSPTLTPVWAEQHGWVLLTCDGAAAPAADPTEGSTP